MNKLTVYHFMSDKFSLYSDIDNIIALKQKTKKRNIRINVKEISETGGVAFDDCDIFFIGGGSDRKRALTTKGLSKTKTSLRNAIEDGMPGLTTCGGYQFLGHRYITPDGTELKGLGVLDFYTESKEERLVGDIIIGNDTFGTVVGFESRGGKTYHPHGTLGQVTYGYSSNDNDREEGVHCKNLLGSCPHDPILPKNHEITNYLLEKTYERKGILFEPKKIDNTEEEAVKQVLTRRAKESRK